MQPVFPTRWIAVEKNAERDRARVRLIPPMAMSNLLAERSVVRFAHAVGMNWTGEGRARALERDWAAAMSAPM